MANNITINTQIQTKPRPRASSFGGFTRIYTPKTALTYERYIASEYQRLGGQYYGKKPLIITLKFYFKTPAGFPKYKKENIYFVACDNHKDLDNLAKSVLDALNTIAYDDDKQVVELYVTKRYTNFQERIQIIIEEPVYKTDKELKEIKNEIKKQKQHN